MTDTDKSRFAIPPEGCASYLTPGKAYRVIPGDKGRGFYVKDDEGDRIYCIWNHCTHANGNWTPRRKLGVVTICVRHPKRPIRETLDGDPLCQECCDQWARAEGATS